jgi:hypothetical protein
MSALNKMWSRLLRIAGPIFGQVIVETNVDNDAGEVPMLIKKRSNAGKGTLMSIDKSVQSPMHTNTFGNILSKAYVQLTGWSTGKVCQKVALHRSAGGMSKKQMCQVIHGTPLSSPRNTP